MKRTQYFTINGDRYEFGPFTVGTLAWIKQKFKTVEAWNRALGADRDAMAIAETVYKLLTPEGKAKFKSANDLAEAMPGDVNYLTILFLRILTLYGQDYGDIVSSLDMENLSEDDLKNLNAALDEKAQAAKDRLAKTAKEDPAPSQAAEPQTPTT